MITVKRNGLSVDITGHAESAEPGRDLVCASASILFYTLVEGIVRLQSEGKCAAIIKDESGDASIKVIAGPGFNETVTEFINHIMIGYEILAESEPDYIRLTI